MRTIAVLTLVSGALGCCGTALGHLGYGMVAGSDGLYFLDSVRAIIWKIGPDGSRSKFATGIHGDHLIRDVDGHFYVEHLNKILWRISPDGKPTQVRLPQTEAKIGGLDELIAIDPNGNLYFANGNPFVSKAPRILKVTAEGVVDVLAGSTTGHADGKGAEAKFTTINSAAWGRDGALYVTDGNRIRRVSLDGKVTTFASREEFGQLLGIAMDAAGDLFVADTEKRCVWRVGEDGGVSIYARSARGWVPVGVAVFANVLWISERQFHRRRFGFRPPRSPTIRVLRIDAEGRQTLFAP
jgi:sugar lactone lactonase YvrE